MSDLTRILQRIENGEVHATDELMPLVYDQLRQLAAAKLAHEKPGQTLQATALVNEAYVRLLAGGDEGDEQKWESGRHFFAAAAESMRRILIDRARHKNSLKRGGEFQRIEMENVEPSFLPIQCDDILGLDEALTKLNEVAPRKAELVKLRFFAGLTVSQAAKALNISTTTAENDWAYARSWLRLEMTK